MPMYDYKCSSCEHTFERIVSKYNTEEKQECPECGKDATWTLSTGKKLNVKFLFNYMEN
jgi:putative FmdB family regulatory protein